MAQDSELSKMKMETKTTLRATDIRIHNYSFDAGARPAAEGNAIDRINRAAKQATQPVAPSTLKMGAFDLDFDGLRAQLGDEAPEDSLLREAKALVKEKKFEQALAKLDEVFEINPHHHESIYLKAFCQVQLDKYRAALLTLAPFRGATLTNRLKTRVKCLKEEIRQHTIPMAAKGYSKAVDSQKASTIVQPLRAYAEADPEVGKFHYFLAGALLIDGKVKDAHNVATNGLQVAETDHNELEELLSTISVQFVPKLLGPARDCYRKKKYSAATQKLEQVTEQAGSTTLYKTFEGLLQQHSGRKWGGLFSKRAAGGMKTGHPPGSPAELSELYEYLVEPEMKVARQALEKQQYAKAEKALHSAINCVPAFALANFMYANCVYQQVSTTVQKHLGKDLDESGATELRRCKEKLDEAVKNARIGSQGAAIPDAKRLVDSIDEMRKQIGDVVQQHDDTVHDARIVNGTIDDVIQALLEIIRLTSATDAYSVRNSVQQLLSKLTNLKSNIPARKRKCKGEQARGILTAVNDNFVEPHLQALLKALGR